MVHEVQVIDIDAFTAIDQRRLLRVLSRAIDEEATHMDGEHRDDKGLGNRGRLLVLCRLVSMIREMGDSGQGSGATGSGRKGSRSL
jgi:hypothetical protein